MYLEINGHKLLNVKFCVNLEGLFGFNVGNNNNNNNTTSGASSGFLGYSNIVTLSGYKVIFV